MEYIVHDVLLNIDQASVPLRLVHVKRSEKKDAWNTIPSSVPVCKMSILITDNLNVFIGDKIYNPKYGDILLFAPNELHFANILRDGTLEFFEFYFPANAFTGFRGGDHLLSCFLNKVPSVHNMLSLPEPLHKNLIELVYDCLSSAQAQEDALLFAKAIQILHMVNIGFMNNWTAEPFQSLPEQLFMIINDINAHFMEIAGVHEIAERAVISESYLFRLFRHHIGLTPYQYLNGCKLSHAKMLLANGKSVTSACFDSGFSDCSRFIERFRNEMGITPSKYQKQYRKRKKG